MTPPCLGCFSYFCSCCQIYNTAEDLGKSGAVYLLMRSVAISDCILHCSHSLFITPCVPIMLLRTEARERYDIKVISKDFAKSKS